MTKAGMMATNWRLILGDDGMDDGTLQVGMAVD